MKRHLAVLGVALALLAPTLALAHEYEAGGITVSHPWARATPGGVTIGAAYVEIKAKEGAADALISASSPAAGRVELHTHTMDDGVMKMRQIEKLAIPAGGSALLKPSGDHIMLFDLKAPIKEGDLLPLTLVFEKAGEVKVEATVEAVGAMGAHGSDGKAGDKGHDGHGHH
jgi:copper(I)-binding protein